MKALKFVINSNIFIALAAVSLTFATQVQLGMVPEIHLYLAVIFFATLFDYNLHRFVAVNNKPETLQIEKYKWSSLHLPLIKTFIFVASAGLVGTLVFVETRTLIFLVILGVLTLLYSIPGYIKQGKSMWLMKISGVKTLIIAFVWALATLFLPIIHIGSFPDYTQVILLAAERFAFIFAIAIPFDIRDMKTDTLTGLRTIPIVFGEKKALIISGIALVFSLVTAVINHLVHNMIFIIPACIISFSITLSLIICKRLRGLSLYYHGLLDGCIILYALLICLSYYWRI